MTAIETTANIYITIYGLNKGQKNFSLTMVNITPKRVGEIQYSTCNEQTLRIGWYNKKVIDNKRMNGMENIKISAVYCKIIT